jgi:hypothetical protein
MYDPVRIGVHASFQAVQRPPGFPSAAGYAWYAPQLPSLLSHSRVFLSRIATNTEDTPESSVAEPDIVIDPSGTFPLSGVDSVVSGAIESVFGGVVGEGGGVEVEVVGDGSGFGEGTLVGDGAGAGVGVGLEVDPDAYRQEASKLVRKLREAFERTRWRRS